MYFYYELIADFFPRYMFQITRNNVEPTIAQEGKQIVKILPVGFIHAYNLAFLYFFLVDFLLRLTGVKPE